jgi:hypothetical protein
MLLSYNQPYHFIWPQMQIFSHSPGCCFQNQCLLILSGTCKNFLIWLQFHETFPLLTVHSVQFIYYRSALLTLFEGDSMLIVCRSTDSWCTDKDSDSSSSNKFDKSPPYNLKSTEKGELQSDNWKMLQRAEFALFLSMQKRSSDDILR